MEQIAFPTFPCYIIQRKAERYGRRDLIESGRLDRAMDVQTENVELYFLTVEQSCFCSLRRIATVKYSKVIHPPPAKPS